MLRRIEKKMDKLYGSPETVRDRLESRAETIKNEYSNEVSRIKIRVTDIGDDTHGISIRVYDADHIKMTTILENIDRSLFDDGYNTAWSYEMMPRDNDTFLDDYEFKGAVQATPFEEGKPVVPNFNTAYETSTHRNIH